MSIDDICDYVIQNVIESGETLSNLKLQKLLYYVQAWYLVFEKKPLFEERFQAWVHGPVSRHIYDRYITTKSLYSDFALSDVREGFTPETLGEDVASHVDRVLSVYAKFSGPQLEEMTHREDPWVQARGDSQPWARCEVELDEQVMREYYAQRVH